MALNEITVNENLSNAEIIEKVEEMLTCIETPEMRRLKRGDIQQYTSELEKHFPHLKGRYPQIFTMVMMYERTFDIDKLKWMLTMLDKRRNGEITEQQSDNVVSFKQFEDFAKDKIDYEKEKEGLEHAKRTGQAKE